MQNLIATTGAYAMFTAAVISFNNTAEIDLHFTNNTPQVDVGIYAEFETNRDDLYIECYVKGLDRRDCKCIPSFN